MDIDDNPWADVESEASTPHPGPSTSHSNVEATEHPAVSLSPCSVPDGASMMNDLLRCLAEAPSLSRVSQRYRRKALRLGFQAPLDRVHVLGDENSYGHTGCVNALSWALDGDVLISGSDDTTIRLWRMDSTDSSTPYPYKQSSVIHTGHSANIFNAHLLPYSTRIASVAGDNEVRVFDAERPLTTPRQGRELDFGESDVLLRTFKCHSGRAKRIVTEDSPDLFLTVAEDGQVRQHDLRTQHDCSSRHGGCPAPLVQLPHDLSTLSMSPLAPHLFVVAGESSFGYLFDRRQVGRSLQHEWGVPCNDEAYVTCVRRFGRAQRDKNERKGSEHITGARMAQTNSHEVLLSYSGDAVYLYSVHDQPHENLQPSSVLQPNSKKSSPDRSCSRSRSVSNQGAAQGIGSPPKGPERFLVDEFSHTDDSEDPSEDEENEESEEERDDTKNLDECFKAPVIMPFRRFQGHCNVDTIKDVNFIGAEDELVASGSDDGNFFLWEKSTGRLHGIYEGDGSVVNVIENHPRLPLIACSGIDATIKLFAPTSSESKKSRMNEAKQITERNVSSTRHYARSVELASLLRLAVLVRGDRENGGEGGEGGEPQCSFQ